MAQFINIHPVDLSGSAPVVALGTIYAGDHKANRCGAIVNKGGAPLALGGQCAGTAILADGSTVPLTGTIEGNQAYVELDSVCYTVEGQISVFVKWVDGTLETTLIALTGTVKLTETGAVIQPSTPIPDLPQLLAEIDNMRDATADAEAAAAKSVRYDTAQSLTTSQKAQARANIDAATVNLETMIAPTEYDPPYSYGDYLFVDGQLRQAAQDIPADEPFTQGHWASTNVETGDALTVLGEAGHCVPYDRNGYLSGAQKKQACENIGALHVNDNQGLTDGQKRQGRLNLNAAESGISPDMYGAAGDGVTDDTDAVLTAFVLAQQANVPVVFGYGKTYCVNKEIDIAKRINIYGNGSTVKAINVDITDIPAFSPSTPYEEGEKVIYDSMPYMFIADHPAGAWTGEDVIRLGNWAHVFYIDVDQVAQFPDGKGKGLIENLTIDCAGFCNYGIFISTVGGFELQNLDICGFKQAGIYMIGGFEIFCKNIRIAGASDPSTIGINNYTHDCNFTDITFKNVGTAIHNVGGDNIYTRIHAWNTASQIVPVSVMFDVENEMHAIDCCIDTCAIGFKMRGIYPVFISGLNVIHGGSGQDGYMTPDIMGNVVATVFDTPNAAAITRIKAYGCTYLSPTEEYNLFSIAPGVQAFDWPGNNDSSMEEMGNFPAHSGGGGGGLDGIQIVSDMTGLADSTADRVLVLHDDSSWGTGGPCWFEKSATWSTYGYQRSDNSYVFPVPNQAPLPEAHAPREQLVDIMQTWIGNPDMHHGSSFNNDLFSANCARDESNLFEMDCSAYVNAVLLGITYANSRYALGASADNKEMQYMSDYIGPSKSEYMPKGGLQTSELAMWFAQHGRLFDLPTDTKTARDTLQFGDIIFGSSDTNRPSAYYNIEHCMFVLGTNSNYVVVTESVSVTGSFEQQNLKISFYDLSTLIGPDKYLRVFARPKYAPRIQTPAITPYKQGTFKYNAFLLPISQIRRLTDTSTGTAVNFGELYNDSRSMATVDYLPVIPLSTVKYIGNQKNPRNHDYNWRCHEYDETMALVKSTTIAYASSGNYLRTEHVLGSTTKYVRFSANYLSATNDTIRFVDMKDFLFEITPPAGT